MQQRDRSPLSAQTGSLCVLQQGSTGIRDDEQ